MKSESKNQAWLDGICALTRAQLLKLAEQPGDMFGIGENGAYGLAAFLEEPDLGRGEGSLCREEDASELEEIFSRVVSALGLEHDRLMCLIWSLASCLDERIRTMFGRFHRE